MAKRLRSLEQRRTQRPPTGPRPASVARPRGRRRAGLVLASAGVIVIGAIVVLGGGLVAPGASSSPSPVIPTSVPSTAPTDVPTASPTDPPAATGVPVISGIACDVDEKTTYHVHAHLNIRFEGELQAIADNVGLRESCLYWLHTHAAHGVIHVEAPAETTFTLGQFFDVWGEPLSKTQVLGRTIGPGEILSTFVDRLPYGGDPRGIVLGNLVAIELQIGPAPLEPLPYTFPADLE